MSHDVFICHSSKDREAVSKVLTAIESSGYSCWIAPRDIRPGHMYPEEIVEAIKDCSVMVLIYTSNSAESQDVGNEVAKAWKFQKPVIPFRVENVPITDFLEYYIGHYQWIDAYQPPLARHFPTLVSSIQDLTHKTIAPAAANIASATIPAAPQYEKKPVQEPVVVEPARAEAVPVTPTVKTGTTVRDGGEIGVKIPAGVTSDVARKPSKKLFYGIVAVVAVIALLAIIYFAWPGPAGGSTDGPGNNLRAVKTGDNVSVDYTLTVEGAITDTSDEWKARQAGVYDSNRTYGPIWFVVGNDEVIEGFDKAMIGMKIGDTKEIVIPPEQGYGLYDVSLIQPVAMSDFTGAGLTPRVGETYYYGATPVKIYSIPNSTAVLVDFNHPLAGKTLSFSITLVSIK